MNIVLVSYPFAPVGSQTAGGAEQILGILERGLIDRGHRTTVVAAEGSQTAGRRLTMQFDSPTSHSVKTATWERLRVALDKLLEQQGADVVHYHGFDFPAYLTEYPVPLLATLHLSPECYFQDVFELRHPRLWLNCVSNSQRSRCPRASHLLDTVTNGIELDRWAYGSVHDGYVVWLGRICPEKGVHNAIIAAKTAKKRLILCGQVFPYPEHAVYFQREIAPRLDSDRIYVGPLHLEARSELLRHAQCLLVPTEAAETSCLSAMEASASGTPVVALNRGAIPEVVAHGVTGWVVESAEELPDAIHRASSIDRPECRRVAETLFDSSLMVQSYERLYLEIRRLHAGLDPALERPGSARTAV